MNRTIGLTLLLGVSLVAQSLDRVWRSQVYGYVFEIPGMSLQEYVSFW